MRISVIGAGSWGTAVSWLLGGKGYDVSWWSREVEIAEGVNTEHRNPLYLPDIVLAPSVVATPDIEQALVGAEAVVMVTPRTSEVESMPLLDRERLAPRLHELIKMLVLRRL